MKAWFCADGAQRAEVVGFAGVGEGVEQEFYKK
jgi:hypothetical protein